ncbi:hypothetical protein AAG570_002932 [Ranatra chinensis]|uniref:Protein SERAC1 n=1 Tax=Ranatra chinensis TaxID=642074 RepID=A0ABD0YJM0_9HEMI
MVEIGALPLILDVQKHLVGNLESTLLLGRLIMKISLYPELLKDLFVTGWIGIIAKWAQSSDQRLSIPAACALANLDQDSNCKYRYGPDVFILHPMFRSNETAHVDVVLIHGLLGGINYTWKQRTCNEPVTIFGITSSGDSLEILCSKVELINDNPMDKFTLSEDDEESLGSDYQFIMTDLPVSGNFESNEVKFALSGEDLHVRRNALLSGFSYCWPRDWLPQDCKHLRIVGINYDSRLSDWLSWCPLRDSGRKNALAAKADDLLEQLIRGGVGKRPIVWITHSMGGLILKQMLIKGAHQSSDVGLNEFYKNTKSIVFLSTPHMGSPLASFNEASRLLLLPSPEVNELRVNSPALKHLHHDFLNIIKENPIQIVTFVETQNVKITALELEVECVPPIFACKFSVISVFKYIYRQGNFWQIDSQVNLAL